MGNLVLVHVVEKRVLFGAGLEGFQFLVLFQHPCDISVLINGPGSEVEEVVRSEGDIVAGLEKEGKESDCHFSGLGTGGFEGAVQFREKLLEFWMRNFGFGLSDNP